MASGNRRKQSEGYWFYDVVGGGVNPIPPYQAVSLATVAEVDAAKAAGRVPQGLQYGDVVVPTPVAGGLATRQIHGVTEDAGWSIGNDTFAADRVNVTVSGVALVQFSAAMAFDPNALVTAALRETRTDRQTPFTNAREMQMLVDPRFPVTYQLALAAVLTVTPVNALPVAAYYPLGRLLAAVTAKYDVAPVELETGRFYA